MVAPETAMTLSDFKKTYANDIVKAQQKSATTYDKEKGRKAMVRYREWSEPFILKRAKKGNMDELPSSNEFHVWIPLSKCQREAYEELLRVAFADIKPVKGNVLPIIFKLRQLCQHPFLSTDHAITAETTPSDLIQMCPKLEVAVQLITKWTEHGHKVLVFSSFLKNLEIIQFVLDQMEGVSACRITGDVSGKNRKAIIDDFNDKDTKHNVMLLSSQIGSEGLNLTGASRIIIFDPHWTEAGAKQAEARILRPGQTKQCVSVHFFAAGTVEEKVS